jgi:flagellar biosynthesis protein FlhF
MEVKRFFSTTMQEALKQVRETLGPDAVILSNSKVEGGVEIVAALDYEEDISPESIDSQLLQNGEPSPSQLARMHADKHLRLQKELDIAKRKIEDVKAKRQESHEKVIASPEPLVESAETRTATEALDGPWNDLSDMRAEIMEIKSMMTGQAAQQEKKELAREQSLTIQNISRKLDSLCIVGETKRKLVSMVDAEMDYAQAWGRVIQGITALVSVAQDDLVEQKGVIALVGPTGSGKTMTIGKMAARYVIQHGSDDIALVTTDRYRIAAHEQLKVFGRILNVPVHTVDEHNSLDSILDQLSHKKLVLVDTAGLMHTDSCWSEQLQELKLSSHDIKNYLVVSSVGQYQVMCSNYHHYKMVELSGAIISKVDEAVSLGEVINFLIDTRLKARFFTDGQRVPEDIHVFSQKEILDRAQSLLNSSERWVTINSLDEKDDQGLIFSHSA